MDLLDRIAARFNKKKSPGDAKEKTVEETRLSFPVSSAEGTNVRPGKLFGSRRNEISKAIEYFDEPEKYSPPGFDPYDQEACFRWAAAGKARRDEISAYYENTHYDRY